MAIPNAAAMTTVEYEPVKKLHAKNALLLFAFHLFILPLSEAE